MAMFQRNYMSGALTGQLAILSLNTCRIMKMNRRNTECPITAYIVPPMTEIDEPKPKLKDLSNAKDKNYM